MCLIVVSIYPSAQEEDAQCAQSDLPPHILTFVTAQPTIAYVSLYRYYRRSNALTWGGTHVITQGRVKRWHLTYRGGFIIHMVVIDYRRWQMTYTGDFSVLIWL